jgi:hypothetical protein
VLVIKIPFLGVGVTENNPFLWCKGKHYIWYYKRLLIIFKETIFGVLVLWI